MSGHKELKLLAVSFGHGMCMKYIWNAIIQLLKKNVWKVWNPVNRIVLYRFPVQPNLEKRNLGDAKPHPLWIGRTLD